MPVESLISVLGLLLVAAGVAVVSRNIIRIPYTIALVVVGLVLGFTHIIESIHLSKELILVLFLPPLLFEGALNMDLDILRDNALGVLLLALFGTILSALALGVFVQHMFHINWVLAFLIGAILAPTDPVSVLALFREQGVGRDLSTIVEGESVFNDGLGVVLYLILLQGTAGQAIRIDEATQLFFWEVLIGAACGLGLGYLCHRLLGRIDDRLVEVMFSVLLAFGCYVVADRFHASGVIAVVVAGLIIGNYGQSFSMSPGTRLALTHFWEVIAFIINSLLFLLIGIQLESFNLIRQAENIVAVFVFMTAVRLILVYAFAAVLKGFNRPWQKSWRSAIAWGGLKGSIPIALTLGLPPDFPNRQDLVSVIFGVVLLSLLVQGLSFKGLLRRMGIGRPSAEQLQMEELLGRIMETNASFQTLEHFRSEGAIPISVYEEKVRELEDVRRQLESSFEEIIESHPKIRSYYFKRLDRDLLKSRLTALADGLRTGILKEETVEKLSKEIIECLMERDCVQWTSAKQRTQS